MNEMTQKHRPFAICTVAIWRKNYGQPLHAHSIEYTRVILERVVKTPDSLHGLSANLHKKKIYAVCLEMFAFLCWLSSFTCCAYIKTI